MNKQIQLKDNNGNNLYPKAISVIDETKNNQIYEYKRLTDSGYIKSPIYEKTLYLKNIIEGTNEFDITDDNHFIQEDYLKYSFNKVGITVTNIEYFEHKIHFVFTSTVAYDSIYVSVNYSALTSDNYDTISVTINSSSLTSDSTVVPSIAKFKYNKDLALALTSDDQGVVELENNFAYFNGYTTFNPILYPCPYKADEYLLNIEDNAYPDNQYAPTHEPLTYSDGIGGVRRFSMTSAVFGYDSNTTNYTKMNGNDAKMMRRYRWSFAHHDASKADLDDIIKEFKTNSEAWASYTGVGLKVMVEPNGNHTYLDATALSPELCMAVFQNDTDTYKSYSLNADDWTTNKDITSFRFKPQGGFIRNFFQGNEYNFFENILPNGSGKIVMGGTHGLGTEALAYLKNISDTRDDIWVASTDEIWEYYHNYNNSKISNIKHMNGSMSFDILVPKYSKHQFAGELTINVPLTNVTSCTLSENNTIGGYRQNSDKFTINTGVETQIYDDISHTIELVRQSNAKATIVRDAQYLINLLMDGELKTIYQTTLDNIINNH